MAKRVRSRIPELGGYALFVGAIATIMGIMGFCAGNLAIGLPVSIFAALNLTAGVLVFRRSQAGVALAVGLGCLISVGYFVAAQLSGALSLNVMSAFFGLVPLVLLDCGRTVHREIDDAARFELV